MTDITEARVSTQSQSHRLRSRLEEAGFTHGDGARVHLPNVELRQGQEGPRAYFCRVGPVEIVEQLEEGDGKALPKEAELQGLVVPDEGLHRLENVIVRTNGRMLVEADSETTIKRDGVLARLGRFFRRLAGTDASGTHASGFFWPPW